MDPDTTLEELMDLVSQIRSGVHTHRERGYIAEDLAAKFDQLDSWIRAGGTLPKEWNHDRAPDPRHHHTRADLDCGPDCHREDTHPYVPFGVRLN